MCLMYSPSPDEYNYTRTAIRRLDDYSSDASLDDVLKSPYKHQKNNKFYVPPKTQSEIIKMLETETFHKETLSPFNPLPAIGQKLENIWEDKHKEKRNKSVSSLQLNSLDKRKQSAPNHFQSSSDGDSIQSIDLNSTFTKQKPIPILNEINLRNQRLSVAQPDNYEKVSDLLKEIKEQKAKKLKRQNTYHVLDPVFLRNPESGEHLTPTKSKMLPEVTKAVGIIFNDHNKSHPDKTENKADDSSKDPEPLDKSCATILLGPKLFSMFETKRRLLERREREIIPITMEKIATARDSEFSHTSTIVNDPVSPGKISDLKEIFDNLQISRKYKEKVRKANYWF